MSHAILISNNEVTTSLFEVNLRAYVATKLTVVEDLVGALDVLEENPEMDAVILYRDAIGEMEEVFAFIEELNSKNLTIPLVSLGELEEEITDAVVIKSKYNIKGLLQAMAKILNVTAKEMAAVNVEEYFPIPLSLFNPSDGSYCDLYYRQQEEGMDDKYVKIMDQGLPLGSYQRDFQEKGETHLYIESNKRLHFINQASAALITELDRPDITVDEQMEITQQAMGMVAEEVFESEQVSAQVAEVSKACLQTINKVIRKVPKLKGLLEMLLENPSDYCYKHSVLSTYIASKVIDKISWGTVEQQNKVAFSFFFHDIFLVPLYKKYPNAITEEDLLFTDTATEAEKEAVLDHAKRAGQLVKSFPRCPMGADMIITQHHGMTNGQGFATSFKDDISPLAKIMIVAEDIASSIMLDSDKHQKIKIDREKICNQLVEKYRNHTYKKIIDAFKEAKI